MAKHFLVFHLTYNFNEIKLGKYKTNVYVYISIHNILYYVYGHM